MNARMLKATLLSTVLTLGVFAGPAFADYPPAEPPEPPEVDDEVDEVDDEVDEVDEVVEMPVTGADAGALAAGGVGLLALGGLALRRRDPADTP